MEISYNNHYIFPLNTRIYEVPGIKDMVYKMQITLTFVEWKYKFILNFDGRFAFYFLALSNKVFIITLKENQMAYNLHLADRIDNILAHKKVAYEVKKMMGGLCYMVDDKMCFGIHFDKKRQTDLLMARVGESAYVGGLQKQGSEPMDFTGRPMKGYLFVKPEGFDMEVDLEDWLQMCLDFNPKAPKNKKSKSV